MSFDVKGLLTTEYGKAAYAALEKLNPSWTYMKLSGGELYLSPDITIKFQGGNGGHKLHGGFGHSADDIVAELHANLLEATKPRTIGDQIALANAFSEGYPRAAFKHDGDGRFYSVHE